MHLVKFWLPVMVGPIRSKVSFEGFISEVIECTTGWRLDGTSLPKEQVTDVIEIAGTAGKLLNVSKVIRDTYMPAPKQKKTDTENFKLSEQLRDTVRACSDHIRKAFHDVYGRSMEDDEIGRYLSPLTELCEFGSALAFLSEHGFAKDYVSRIKELGLKFELEILSQEPPEWLRQAVSKNHKCRKPA